MARSLAQASAQIQSYIDFLHQYNQLPPRSLRRFADRRVRLALAQTVLEGAERSEAGTLTDDEQTEFDSYLHVGNLLAVLQSKARVALRRDPPAGPSW